MALVNKKKRIIEAFWAVEACLGLVLLLSIPEPEFLTPFNALIVLFMCLFVAPYLLAKQDKIIPATNLIIIISTFLLLSFVWQNSGLNDEVMLVFPLITAFSILFGSIKLLRVILLIMVINIILLGVLNEYEIVNHVPPKGGLLTASFTLLIFVLITFTLGKFGTDLANALSHLNSHQNKLEENVAERTKELEAKIVELNIAHKQLSEAEKMASLGRLVAGISHEINTPVGIAVTAASHLQDKTKEIKNNVALGNIRKSELDQFIETSIQSSALIDTNLRRAADLIGDFKNLAVLNTASRRSVFILKTSLEEIVASVQPALEEAQVNLILNCDENIEIFHDQGALAQILVNLITNSCIHGLANTQNANITLNICLQNENVNIVYSDNGVGLTDEVAEKIFEPFYTTKRNKGGTGLGMNIVYNLIKQTLLGSIKISKNKPSGVIFDICFPQKAPQ